jgi:hypothetical protein
MLQGFFGGGQETWQALLRRYWLYLQTLVKFYKSMIYMLKIWRTIRTGQYIIQFNFPFGEKYLDPGFAFSSQDIASGRQSDAQIRQ